MKVIEKRGSEQPSLYEIKQNAGTTQLLINVDVRQEQAAGPESGEDQWVWNALTFAPGEHSYGAIVDALIQHKYPYSKMESVTSNYLMETDVSVLIELLLTTQNFNKLRQAMSSWLSSRDSAIVAEYNTMQEYRKYAKQLARTIVNEFEPNPEEE